MGDPGNTKPVANPRRIVKRPLDTVPEDVPRGLDQRGRLVVIPVDPADEAQAKITVGGDGVRVQSPRSGAEYASDLTPVNLARDLDALSAMQIGMARLLQGLTIEQLNLEALLKNDDVQSRGFKLSRIFFDWPTNEDDEKTTPSACVMCPDDRLYERQDLSTVLLEETLHVFGAGTVLRKLAEVTCELVITFWDFTKEERRGMAAAMERGLLSEPGDDRQGRRVAVEEYFDRAARFDLKGIKYADSADAALAKQWVMQARIAADIDRVVLVVAPPLMQVPTIPVDI
jgi:hypothetical protein